MNGTATISYILVQQSYATIAITPDPTCNILLPTLDTDNNGHIDRIRVLVLPGTRLSDFLDNPAANVEGYQLSSAVPSFVTGPQAGDSVFDILLQEQPYLDSDARPRWQ